MIVTESQKENYRTVIENGSAVITADVMEDKGGSGLYFRPHDLLCSGLASCLNITTRMILDRKNLSYEKVIVKVDLDRSDPAKSRFCYHIEIVGDIPEEVKQHVMEIAGKCPVKKTLSNEIVFEQVQSI